MNCRICSAGAQKIFKGLILRKYEVQYYHCLQCDFLHTENPYWLQEAYKMTIHPEYTGILSNNLACSKVAAQIIVNLFDRRGKFLDFAGGYGILTRLMRDLGLDFYWADRYTPNLVAQGFEYNQKEISDIELITSFESFEHFVQPLEEIRNMLKISSSILFSTSLLPQPIPKPEEWQYYGLNHGQHISFYGVETLRYLAKTFRLNIYTNGVNFHLLTQKKTSDRLFNFLLHFSSCYIGNKWARLFLKSKTMSDQQLMEMRSQNKTDTLKS